MPSWGDGVAPMLQACLNGARTSDEHPAIPRTPEELGVEARAAVDAGAEVLHLHPYDRAGMQTLAAEPCAAALRAVRSACPGIPISLSTSEVIERDPRRRLELTAGWIERPELVTANQGERGIVELCEHLIRRGVGIEAGLLSADDARASLESLSEGPTFITTSRQPRVPGVSSWEGCARDRDSPRG